MKNSKRLTFLVPIVLEGFDERDTDQLRRAIDNALAGSQAGASNVIYIDCGDRSYPVSATFAAGAQLVVEAAAEEKSMQPPFRLDRSLSLLITSPEGTALDCVPLTIRFENDDAPHGLMAYCSSAQKQLKATNPSLSDVILERLLDDITHEDRTSDFMGFKAELINTQELPGGTPTRD